MVLLRMRGCASEVSWKAVTVSFFPSAMPKKANTVLHRMVPDSQRVSERRRSSERHALAATTYLPKGLEATATKLHQTKDTFTFCATRLGLWWTVAVTVAEAETVSLRGPS